MAEGLNMPGAPGRNTGHGHVFPRPDRARARCGGTLICSQCQRDAARKAQMDAPNEPSNDVPPSEEKNA